MLNGAQGCQWTCKHSPASVWICPKRTGPQTSMRTAPWCALDEEDQLAAPDLLAETSERQYAHRGFAAQSAADMCQCCSIAAAAVAAAAVVHTLNAA